MKNLWKKIAGVSLGAVMALGVGVSVMLNQGVVEAKATDVTDNIAIKGYAGSSTSGYVSTETADSTQLAYGLKANNYNPGSGQVRGNKTALVNFYLGNTAAKGDNYYIKSVTLNITSGSVTTSTSARSMCEFGTAEISTAAIPTGGQAADTSGTGQTTVVWTVANAETSNYKYFCIYGLQTSGTCLAAGTNAVEVLYGESGSTSDVVTAIAATPTSASYTVGDAIVAPTSVTATVNGVEGQTYTNYSAAVGTLADGTFTPRTSVTFGTTTAVAADNCVRITALDANTEGGSAYEHADIALTVSAPTLTALTMNETSADINKSGTLQLSVTPTPAAADASVTWSVSPSGIVTVDENGLVTAGTTAGDAVVTATSTTVSSITATCAVTVIDAKTYNLVTSTSQLVDGAKVVIAGVNGTTYTALSSTQNTNNRGQVSATVTDSVITPAAGYAELTLGVETKDSTTVYTFLDASGYLYAASTSSNYLRSQATNDDNGRWTVVITDGAFAITAQGTNTHNVLQYNSSSSIFSAYTTASQKPVQLYIKSSTPTPAEEAAAYAANFLTATEDCTTSAAGVWAAQKAAYLELSTDAQAVLTNATYSGITYADATATQKCVWRYDLAVAKQSLENFMSRTALVINPASNVEGLVKSNSTKTSIIIITIVGVVGLSAIVGYYFISKKSKHEND